MFLRLLLLFTIVPVCELALLIEVGQRLGVIPTVALVLGTGVLGAALARREGTQALYRMRTNMSQGKFPGEEIFDGVLILTGGLLLLTPGLLTDLLGFSVLVPFGRRLIKGYLKAAIAQRLRPGSVETHYTVH
jgi:UPF0716 protein FxsA